MTTVSLSKGLHVHGYVRNEADGSVLMDVEGSASEVAELLRRIADTMRDQIDGTDVEELPTRSIDSGFKIRY